jgi:hypothetical protein
LKVIANETGSEEGALVCNISTINMSLESTLRFDIRSNVTGENIRIGIRNAAPNYSADFLTGGTALADNYYNLETNPYAAACDDDNDTFYRSGGYPGLPHWWQYDFGAGNEKIVNYISILPQVFTNPAVGYSFINGSQDNETWTPIVEHEWANSSDLEEFTFANTNAYRYYRIEFNSSYEGQTVGYKEIQMKQSTGGSAETLSEITPNITTMNTWQTVGWDISGINASDKAMIDNVIITMNDATQGNIFYIDNFTVMKVPEKARLLILEKDIDTITLNTDLIAAISRNGANWTNVTLYDVGDFNATYRILSSNVTDINTNVGSGFNMSYKLTTLGENLTIKGASLTWD